MWARRQGRVRRDLGQRSSGRGWMLLAIPMTLQPISLRWRGRGRGSLGDPHEGERGLRRRGQGRQYPGDLRDGGWGRRQRWLAAAIKDRGLRLSSDPRDGGRDGGSIGGGGDGYGGGRS
jgi:hypothetical protein